MYEHGQNNYRLKKRNQGGNGRLSQPDEKIPMSLLTGEKEWEDLLFEMKEAD